MCVCGIPHLIGQTIHGYAQREHVKASFGNRVENRKPLCPPGFANILTQSRYDLFTAFFAFCGNNSPAPLRSPLARAAHASRLNAF